MPDMKRTKKASIKRRKPPTPLLKKRALSPLYLDHAASTPLSPRVEKFLTRSYAEYYGNPSSLHEEGVRAHTLLEEARKKVATVLSAHPDEIIFTSGGTESVNSALCGIVRALYEHVANPHLVISSLEHAKVKECEHLLSKEDVSCTFAEADGEGVVTPDALDASLTRHTLLVSCMYANNEIGAIQPIRDLMKVVRRSRKDTGAGKTPYFFCDASQAAGYLPLGVPQLGVDALSLDPSKFYGPRGIGILYLRRGTPFSPLLVGGSQEGGRRAGTENPVLAYAAALALEEAEKMREEEVLRLVRLRDAYREAIMKALPDAKLNGPHENRLPNNINICIPGVDAEHAVLILDAHKIYASSASACAMTHHGSRSGVIERLHNGAECAGSSLRLTLGRSSTSADIKRVVLALREVYENARGKNISSRELTHTPPHTSLRAKTKKLR